MILLLSVLAGLIAGQCRAWWHKRPLQKLNFKNIWLVPVGALLQWVVLGDFIREIQPEEILVRTGLIVSQFLLLLFILQNRKIPGMWILGLGLGLNLMAITANGGLMPVDEFTLRKLFPSLSESSLREGMRIPSSKDFLLSRESTRLWWLTDWIVFPRWTQLRIAFSPGDFFIGWGAFSVLWFLGGESANQQTPGRSNLFSPFLQQFNKYHWFKISLKLKEKRK